MTPIHLIRAIRSHSWFGPLNSRSTYPNLGRNWAGAQIWAVAQLRFEGNKVMESKSCQRWPLFVLLGPPDLIVGLVCSGGFTIIRTLPNEKWCHLGSWSFEGLILVWSQKSKRWPRLIPLVDHHPIFRSEKSLFPMTLGRVCHFSLFEKSLSQAARPFFTKMSSGFFRRITGSPVYNRRWDCSIQSTSAKNLRSNTT